MRLWMLLQMGGMRVTNLRYADDIILIACSAMELQTLVDRLDNASKKYGQRIHLRQSFLKSGGVNFPFQPLTKFNFQKKISDLPGKLSDDLFFFFSPKLPKY